MSPRLCSTILCISFLCNCYKKKTHFLRMYVLLLIFVEMNFRRYENFEFFRSIFSKTSRRKVILSCCAFSFMSSSHLTRDVLVKSK